MIIGINGKMGSGKDTVGKIIQYLCWDKNNTESFNKFLQIYTDINKFTFQQSAAKTLSGWEVKKFADKLKDIVCLLLNCTREQLEDHDFKNTELGEEWWYFNLHKINNDKSYYEKIPYLGNEIYLDLKDRIELVKLTPRLLLQLLGTDCGRDIIHPNIWVNSVMADYNKGRRFKLQNAHTKIDTLDNWIITDMRFPNEMEAVKSRNGITIRVDRILFPYTDSDVKSKLEEMGYRYFDNEDFSEDAINEGFEFNSYLNRWNFDEDIPNQHPSETALDNANFDYVIDNNGTIEELIEKVKEILTKISF